MMAPGGAGTGDRRGRPLGVGQSRLAARLGLPVLRLDDFYRSAGDPALPLPPGGLVDWDDPGSWLHDEAVAAVEELCRTGRCDIPEYDIARDSRFGHRVLDLGGAELFVAEGIFAQEVVAECRGRGLVAEAICVTRHPVATFSAPARPRPARAPKAAAGPGPARPAPGP